MRRDWVRVRLEPLHINFADHVAGRRYTTARELGREFDPTQPTDYESAIGRDILGARCEAAAKLFLNPVRWNLPYKRITGIPDFDDFIDAKGIRKDRHKLLVKPDDDPEWAYLCVNATHHPTYWILGWKWGYEAKRTEFSDDPVGGYRAFFVPQDELRSPVSLLPILRKRQQGREIAAPRRSGSARGA
jgi:hypothetical protein